MTTHILQPASSVRSMLDIPKFCFLLASITIVIGMGLGLYMALAQDHQLGPVHAHLNVIGWLSLFMLGLYYRVHPAARGTWVTLQVATMTAGYILMTANLAGLLLSGNGIFLAGAFAGSALLIASMLMLVAIVWRTAVEA